LTRNELKSRNIDIDEDKLHFDVASCDIEILRYRATISGQLSDIETKKEGDAAIF